MPIIAYFADVNHYFSGAERDLLKLSRLSKAVMEFKLRRPQRFCLPLTGIRLRPIMQLEFWFSDRYTNVLPPCCASHNNVNWQSAIAWALSYAPKDNRNYTYRQIFKCLPQIKNVQSALYH